MAIYSSDDLVWCRVFSLSFKDEALDWFHSLQPGTVDGFATLRHLFTQQYTSSRVRGLMYMALVRMRQGRDETLKTFMGRFNQIARQVSNVDQRLIISTLTTALRPRPFVDYIYAEELQTLAELQNRATSFVRIKEGHVFQKERTEKATPVYKPLRKRRDIRKAFKRDDGGS